jgi:hypothetical protein
LDGIVVEACQLRPNRTLPIIGVYRNGDDEREDSASKARWNGDLKGGSRLNKKTEELCKQQKSYLGAKYNTSKNG